MRAPVEDGERFGFSGSDLVSDACSSTTGASDGASTGASTGASDGASTGASATSIGFSIGLISSSMLLRSSFIASSSLLTGFSAETSGKSSLNRSSVV
ncbi:hypothetical protein AXA58_26745 (plasmid) [Klebsiella pneumoniae]|nr:hypothetical protein AXA58_26745 [Klebsiella pneumoniae]